MPSDDVATREAPPTAQNTDPFHAISQGVCELNAVVRLVRWVHVTPSGDVAHTGKPPPTAQNTEPCHAIP